MFPGQPLQYGFCDTQVSSGREYRSVPLGHWHVPVESSIRAWNQRSRRVEHTIARTGDPTTATVTFLGCVDTLTRQRSCQIVFFAREVVGRPIDAGGRRSAVRWRGHRYWFGSEGACIVSLRKRVSDDREDRTKLHHFTRDKTQSELMATSQLKKRIMPFPSRAGSHGRGLLNSQGVDKEMRMESRTRADSYGTDSRSFNVTWEFSSARTAHHFQGVTQ